MGQETSKPRTNSLFSEFPSNYTAIKNINHLPYGQGTVYQKNDDPQFQIIQKAFKVTNSTQKWKSPKIDHMNVINCLGSVNHGRETGVVEKYFYQYFSNTLAQEIQNRSETQSYFSEADLWYLFFSIIQVGEKLQRQIQFHGDIRPANIALTSKNQIRLAPYGTFPKDMTGYEKALLQKSQNQQIYLAPEALEFLAQRAQSPYINYYKSDVFALGMTLLEAMSLIPAVNFYDYPNKKLEEDRIKVILEKLLFQYSELLVRTVSSCFIKNTERRPDFIQLYNLLEPYSFKIQKLEPFNFDLDSAKKKHYESPQKYLQPGKFEEIKYEIKEQEPIVVYQQPGPISVVNQFGQIQYCQSPSQIMHVQQEEQQEPDHNYLVVSRTKSQKSQYQPQQQQLQKPPQIFQQQLLQSQITQRVPQPLQFNPTIPVIQSNSQVTSPQPTQSYIQWIQK